MGSTAARPRRYDRYRLPVCPAFGELRQLGGDGQERAMTISEDMPLLHSDALLYVRGDRPAVPFVRYFMDFVVQLLFHLAVAV